MQLAVGSTTPLSLGPFMGTNGALVTSGTPDVTLYVNGTAQAPTGTVGDADDNGIAKYTPSAADTSVAGELVIFAALAGAFPWWRSYGVGEQEAPTTPVNITSEGNSIVSIGG